MENVAQVVLTVNVPEQSLVDEVSSRAWTFKLKIIHNDAPKGFGANHNAAFKQVSLDFFCVLNPDIDFEVDPFSELLSKLRQPLTGCAFPVQMDEAGQIQDYSRKLPSPSALFVRYLGRKVKEPILSQPEWVNAAFMLFPAKIFGQLKGFDEGYFMYCEDVDICLRLQLAGYQLAQGSTKVTHAAHRNSRINFQHLAWHVTSLFRLWFSTPYRKYYSTKSSK